jgi:L-cystine uptake protein TcyP (sodium:dicarboxylate symporter family)
MVSAGNDLTAAKAFSFVALLNAMRFVLAVLPYSVKALAELTVAVERFGVGIRTFFFVVDEKDNDDDDDDVVLLNAMRFVLAVLPYGVKALAELTVAVERFGVSIHRFCCC